MGELAGWHFPSFSEGLSLRLLGVKPLTITNRVFPFLFGGTFIEAIIVFSDTSGFRGKFPFLFGGTFIEA